MLQIHPVMVFRFRTRRGQNLRPINRIKHVVDKQGAVGSGAQVQDQLIVATDTPTLANTVGVETGSTVNAIYLHVEINATTSTSLPNFYMMVYKNPGGNISGFDPSIVGTNDNKRFVIHQEMVMLQQQDNSNPRTLFNGVIVIPKGYRRFAPNDELDIRFKSPGVSVQYCFQCHYKEFR